MNWPKPSVITAPLSTLSNVVLALGPGNEVSVGWIQTLQPLDVDIYESWQKPDLQRLLAAPHHALIDTRIIRINGTS